MPSEPLFAEAGTSPLDSRWRGELVTPTSPSYDVDRQIWNAAIQRRPALIAYCAGVADVIRAVGYARDSGLPVAVRGGGHSWPGLSVCDDGIVIDVSRMKGCRVDADWQTVRAEAGLTWGELDHETQSFGLAVPGGMVSMTGIAGLTLGGGSQSWLLRKHGATCDNLLAADVVTAEGKLVRASADENSELLWGLRGGGGNFGIVTSFELRLHAVGPEVLAGPVFYPMDKARDVLAFYRDFTPTAPDELTTMLAFMTAPDADFLPENVRGRQMVAIVSCYSGSLSAGEDVVRPLRRFGPPAADLLQPIGYLDLQSMFDATSPPGQLHHSTSTYLPALTDRALDAIAAIGASAPSPLTVAHLNHNGGAFGRAGRRETALGPRTADYAFSISTTWTDPVETEKQTAWTREAAQQMQPFSTGSGYLNFLQETDDGRVRAAFGPNYDRLASLKAQLDPANLFRLNHNILPAGR